MDKFIQNVARTAGDAVLERFGKEKVKYQKTEHPISAVTDADLLSDKIITSAIKKKYPQHGIISEESANPNPDAEHQWIVDPIDGTLNFATGVPYFAVLMAFSKKGRVVSSVVYLPALKEFFFATRGGGVYLNGKKIAKGHYNDWDHSRGCVPSVLVNNRSVEFLHRFSKEAKNKGFVAHNFSAANEPYVVLGRRDWSVSIGAYVWDYAAGALIAEEGGCKVSNLQGKPWSMGDRELLVAGNPALHKQLLKLTKNI